MLLVVALVPRKRPLARQSGLDQNFFLAECQPRSRQARGIDNNNTGVDARGRERMTLVRFGSEMVALFATSMASEHGRTREIRQHRCRPDSLFSLYRETRRDTRCWRLDACCSTFRTSGPPLNVHLDDGIGMRGPRNKNSVVVLTDQVIAAHLPRGSFSTAPSIVPEFSDPIRHGMRRARWRECSQAI